MFFGVQDPRIKTQIQILILPFSHEGAERTEIMLAKKDFNSKVQQKIKFLRLKIMCLRVSIRKKYGIFLASLKSLKKGVRIRGSGSAP
jgi:hypothetical protein